MPKANLSLEELLELIKEDPINGANAAQKRNEGVRIGSYESSISAGALYRRLKESRKWQSAFYALPFWTRNADGSKSTYTKNAAHLNKHCHQFIYGFREGSESKRAEDHASATQSCYDSEKSLDEIFEAMKKGGFDSLRKAAVALKKQLNDIAEEKCVEQDDEDVDSAEDLVPQPSSGGGYQPPTRTSAASARGEGRLPRMTWAQAFMHLFVSMKPDELDQFLAERSSVGDEALIRVVREADGRNGMLIWRAVEIGSTPRPLASARRYH